MKIICHGVLTLTDKFMDYENVQRVIGRGVRYNQIDSDDVEKLELHVQEVLSNILGEIGKDIDWYDVEFDFEGGS